MKVGCGIWEVVAPYMQTPNFPDAMNSKQVFTIGSPCHEDWNKMSAVEQGRFCDVCAKCVVDLSGKSQTEIKDLFEVHEGKLCGSMPVSQYESQQAMIKPSMTETDVAHEMLPQNWLGRSLKPLQIFAAALVLAFGLGTTAQAQSHRKVGRMIRYVASGSVNGVVWNEGAGVGGVRVLAEQDGDVRQATTDDEGKYRFARLDLGKWNIHVEFEGEKRTQTVRVKDGENQEAWFHFNEFLMLGDVAVIEAEVEPIDFIEEITKKGEIQAVDLEKVMEVELEPVPIVVKPVLDARVLGGMEVVTCELPPVAGQIAVVAVEEETLSGEEEIWDGPDFTAEGADISDLQAGEAGEEGVGSLVKVTVHPIPTQDEFTVRIENGLSEKPLELLLFDVEGKLLRTGAIGGTTGSTAKMNIENLPSGVYFLKGLSETYVFDQKILKL